MTEVDSGKWSGEGEFTQRLIDRLRALDGVRAIRVEDAPSTRSEADYQFISNEIYVDFAVAERCEPFKRFGLWNARRTVLAKVMTIAELESALTSSEGVGAPDYADAGMLQYLRTERIIPPYQTRGYKLVELVRIYEAGSAARTSPRVS